MLLLFSLFLLFQVCCSGDILAALPEPTAEPVVEEPVKIQCPSYRFVVVFDIVIVYGLLLLLLAVVE